MYPLTFIRFAFSLFLILLLVGLSRVDAGPAGDDMRIEKLISLVEKHDDAVFIRNGREYSADQAARFLRGKWKANKKEIHSVSDFIDKAATKSSTSGKPYIVRVRGGARIPCADFLKQQLKRL